MPEDFEGLKTLGRVLLKTVMVLCIVAAILIGFVVVTCGGMALLNR
jgi:hypothetical protein